MSDVQKSGATRRAVIGGGLALAGVLLAGCGRAEPREGSGSAAAAPEPVRASAPGTQAMTVYRDPSCGCCSSWAAAARQTGFNATVVESADMPGVKRRLGVPEALASCHTTTVGGYAIEGHVPLADVQRLLAQRPAGIKGLAVPGMPAGSPGMEMPDGRTEPYEVLAFDVSGTTRVFARYG